MEQVEGEREEGNDGWEGMWEKKGRAMEGRRKTAIHKQALQFQHLLQGSMSSTLSRDSWRVSPELAKSAGCLKELVAWIR